MGKYCCFFCPRHDYSEKSLDDCCPSCGRTYGFVLDQPPQRIRDYELTRPLDRGFYGAAYLAKRGIIGRAFVIKISPTSFYQFFPKTPFAQEVRQHQELAQNAEHIVGISDAFENETIQFGGDSAARLPCHVTVLDYVEGPSFKEFMANGHPLSAHTICQIAVDLLRLRAEFEASHLNHNDLHELNLIVQKLGPKERRRDALDDTLRLMAIDLGSVSDASKSSTDRAGDLTFVAEHVGSLVTRLLQIPDRISDRDYRVSLALQEVLNTLKHKVENQRTPNLDDLVEQIREAYRGALHPWRPSHQPLVLRTFGDHYNAQTLDSQNVPRLFVDPDNRWVSEVSSAGPQIVTGMRGCGKTMLLRSLDIHARAAIKDGENPDEAISRLANDKFIGLFVSAQRLLDIRGQSLLKLEQNISRLLVAYALQAARALLHLRDIKITSVDPRSHEILAAGISDLLENAEDLENSTSLDDLDSRLQRTLVLNGRVENRYTVTQPAATVFPHLADTLRKCSRVIGDATVLFLLDDVSTRYLDPERIGALLSALLFQGPSCAFKFTSEWQTIELGLSSPGRNHPIREDRDVKVFDLGADVLAKIKAPGHTGKKFVASILEQRARYHTASLLAESPTTILGDVSLEQVAREIASSDESSAKRKNAYRGLSCLTNVCVGDIGDVIKLYEEISRRAGSQTERPISAALQSECFRDLSARRLYDLNRRKDYFKNHALGFAQAAHELLVRSFKESGFKEQSRQRLRQYSSVYVRVRGDGDGSQNEQIDRLRELIDAGVFVFAGGSPRLKTKDSDPIQQFILSYRKLYGVTAYIGLSDRDRFELSGDDLTAWLQDGADTKSILLRNQISGEMAAAQEASPRGADAEEATVDGSDLEEAASGGSPPQPHQQTLFAADRAAPLKADEATTAAATPVTVAIRPIDTEELARMGVEGVFTGLGFEDRARASNSYLANILGPINVRAVRYSIDGYAREILAAWAAAGASTKEVTYQDAVLGPLALDGLSLIDVSGLAKPLIFSAVRSELINKGRVLVCHAGAEQYYPLQADLERLFAAKQSEQPVAFLESLADILMGEEGPYESVRLLDNQSDPFRARALLAFASPKHQRLFALLDEREYDQIEVVVPTGERPRDKVARYAAEFVCENYQNAKITEIHTDDLPGLIGHLDGRYLATYAVGGANLEVGLTGSKMQAVAAGVLGAMRKISQAWYLKPKVFDEKRFSTGVGEVRVFEILTPKTTVVRLTTEKEEFL